MPTPEEVKGMQAILDKLNQASATPASPSVAGSTSVPPTANVSANAAEMFNILYKLEEATANATKQKFQESKSDITLSTATMQDNTVSVGKYNVVLEKKTVVPGVKKTFYKITDSKGAAIYSDIALFESAMGIIKGLLFENSKIDKILDLDAKYSNYLSEAAIYKYKAKTLTEGHRQDVALAKQGNAATKMATIKKQIKAII